MNCKQDKTRPRFCVTHNLLPLYPSGRCEEGNSEDYMISKVIAGDSSPMAPTTLTRLARMHLENAYNLIQSPLTVAEGESNLIEAQRKIGMAIRGLRKDENQTGNSNG